MATRKMLTRDSDRRREGVTQEIADVRPKNQVTIPQAVVRALGLQPGDRLVFIVDDEESGEGRIYRMPHSFAGVAPHAYGGPGRAQEYLAAERASWEE